MPNIVYDILLFILNTDDCFFFSALQRKRFFCTKTQTNPYMRPWQYHQHDYSSRLFQVNKPAILLSQLQPTSTACTGTTVCRVSCELEPQNIEISITHALLTKTIHESMEQRIQMFVWIEFKVRQNNTSIVSRLNSSDCTTQPKRFQFLASAVLDDNIQT